MGEETIRAVLRQRDEVIVGLRRKIAELSTAGEIVRLRAENEALSKQVGALNLGVSSGGTVSIRGTRAKGLFLFKQEALSILANADQLRQFILDNDARLRQSKEDKRFVRASGPRLVERKRGRR